MRTGNLGKKFHLKRELYHGVPVVNALVWLEVLADVFAADWFCIKTQAAASLVRKGFEQGCVDVQLCPTAMPPFPK